MMYIITIYTQDGDLRVWSWSWQESTSSEIVKTILSYGSVEVSENHVSLFSAVYPLIL